VDSATEEQVAEFLAQLRQDIKDYYRPAEKLTRITIIDPIEHGYDGLLSHMIDVAKWMRYSGPPLKMTEIDYSSIEKRVTETLESKKDYFKLLSSWDESHYIWPTKMDESSYIKPTKMGAGKNPFAEPQITKYRR
jgi:hypothetical protein